jgi:hypothetical protein
VQGTTVYRRFIYLHFRVQRGILMNVAFAAFGGLLDALLVLFLIGPVYSWVHGLFYAAFYLVLGKLEQQIQPAEILLWSWRSVKGTRNTTT